MRCPVCYNRIKYEGTKCKFCGFKTSELNSTTNKGIYKLRRAGQGEKVIYTKKFPADLSFKKTFWLTLLLGWFGMHNYYVGQIFKGIFVTVGFILSVAMGVILTNYPELSILVVQITIYTAPLIAGWMIAWFIDIGKIITKTLKVPVALKKDLDNLKEK